MSTLTLDDYLIKIQELSHSSPQPEAVLYTLQQIEQFCYINPSPTNSQLAESLLPLLSSSSWLVQAKSLVTISRIGNSDLSEPIWQWSIEQTALNQRLQGIDAWWSLPHANHRHPKIAALLGENEQPLILRAGVWLLGQTADQDSAKLFGAFISKPTSGVINDDFLTHIWYKISQNISQEHQKQITEECPQLAAWLRYRSYQLDGTIYSLYPSNDYLWQHAKAQGITLKQFKAIYFKPRNKKEPKISDAN